MNEFDNRAREWDKETIHWERSKAIAEEVLKTIPICSGMKALEYGAGTGILSSLLSEEFVEITLMDNSEEMVNVTKEKVAAYNLHNLKPLLFNLEQSEYNSSTFDFVFTQMALHHVSDVQLVLNRFYQILNPEGYLAIADLYTEDGSFHGSGFTGHNGFNTELLKADLEKIGFTHLSTKQCFVMKKSAGGSLREFPVFLLIAKKS